MSLVLDFRVDAAGLSEINKGLGVLKRIETQSKSTARAGLVNLTKAFEQSMTSMTGGEKAAIKFQNQLANISRPSQLSTRSLAGLAAQADLPASKTAGPLRTSLETAAQSFRSFAADSDTYIRKASRISGHCVLYLQIYVENEINTARTINQSRYDR